MIIIIIIIMFLFFFCQKHKFIRKYFYSEHILTRNILNSRHFGLIGNNFRAHVKYDAISVVVVVFDVTGRL